MLLEIIRKEILEHLMGLRFSIACVLCFVVMTCSLFVRLQDYGVVQMDYHENVDQTNKQIKDMDQPWMMVWRGFPVHQEPNPLKVFVRGVDASNGMSLHVKVAEPVEFRSAFLTNALTPLFPAMDMVSFVGIIMSLLAIVFGYDAICGEKHRGTLRLMISYSIPRDTILLGKWLGGVMTLIIPFLLTVIAAVMIVFVQPNVSLTPNQWMRFAGLCGLGILYTAAIYSLAMWVSTMTRRPSTSVMILVTIWLILILAVPNLSPYVAQSIKPTQDPTELESARMTQQNDIWKNEIYDKMDVYDKQNGFTGGRWWEKLDWNDPKEWRRGKLRWIFELTCIDQAYNARDEAFARIDEKFERQLDEQVRLSRWISRISPFASLNLAAAELTDTGLLTKQRFINQVRDYRLQITETLIPQWLKMEHIALDRGSDRPRIPWPPEDEPILRFSYTPPAGGDYARLILPDVGLLAGMMILFFLLSFVTFLRYDAR